MSLSPNAKSPCAATAGPICPSSSHRISSKNRPPFLGGMDSPCASSNKALTWPTRQANSDPWKSRLAESCDDIAGRWIGHYCVGASSFQAGALGTATEHFQKALALDDLEQARILCHST